MKLLENKKIINISAIVIIIFFSILVCWPLMKDGFYEWGHDNIFHFSQVNDLYKSIKSNQGIGKISTNLFHGIGYGTRLFYSSLSHILVVIIGLIIEPFGLDLLAAYKILIFLSVFISGLIVYFFMKRVVNNHYYALIAAIIYVIFPYRITDIYIRNAFAEVLAFTFLPGVFWGAYEIIHQVKKDFWSSVKGYWILAINYALLFASHNITATYCAIFVLIYLLINCRKVYSVFSNNKRNFIFAPAAIFLIAGTMMPLAISILEQNMAFDYTVFNTVKMWTTLDHLMGEIGRATQFLTYGFNYFEANLFMLIYTLSLALVAFLILRTFLRGPHAKKIYITAPILIMLVMPILLKWNKDVPSIVNISSAVIGAFIFIVFLDHRSKDTFSEIKDNMQIISYGALLAIALILIYSSTVWHYLPSFLYNIQFPWRIWIFVALFSSICVPLIANFIKCNYFYKKIALAVACAFFTVSIFPVNKVLQTAPVDINNYPYSTNAGGWQKEYLPDAFFDNEGYHERSPLYRSIRTNIDKDIDIVFHPYSTNANMVIENEYIKAPNYRADIIIDKDTEIQIPFIYYIGYQAKINVVDSKKNFKVKVYESDFLVTIKLETKQQTTFHVNLSFKGTSLMQVADKWSIFACFALAAIPFVPLTILIIDKSKKKLDKKN